MTRTVSPAGRAALTAREGCLLHAYRDTTGVPTIGVGHTGRAAPPAVTVGMTITAAEADSILAADLAPIEAAVAGAVPADIGQNEFDALVSLAFNIGAKGFVGSTVVHKLATGDRAGAADAFLMWVHPPELASRRRAERMQFLRPDAPLPVPPPLAGPHLLPRPQPGLWARIVAALTTRKAA
ncbi:lysozyme [Lichenibacterium ramalinae]|uniref:Lysozyme n=1 Tax=Lichenibacterium ramalinae TaxID=2316527 RepID=A0A4Q2RBR2_9HYPH|nr:lysozyme [Lichenibacterium ramalinae]RYB03959.1 lysozyme [Lichenibacterium ramalinae]